MPFIPFWENKVWGRVMHVFASPHAAVSYLMVEKHTWCSRHLHQARANVFVAITATLEVLEWGPFGQRSKLLKPGNAYEVPSGIEHQFRVIDDGELIEIYYADRGGTVDIDDIVRFTEGGRTASRS